jgi:hypothetical protein
MPNSVTLINSTMTMQPMQPVSKLTSSGDDALVLSSGAFVGPA